MTEVLSLDGAWTLHRPATQESFPARVPGVVHADLRRADAIAAPFERDHERHLQWIGEETWVYRRHVEIPAELLAADAVYLCCDGLDTLATVRLNGQVVAETDNMYRRWQWDVQPLLREGDNTLEITFASPLPLMAARQAARALPGWYGPLEPAGRAWVRKQPSNFGWDWGPVLITCGIWKPIWLEARRTARLHDVHVQQHHADGGVTLSIRAQAETYADAGLYVRCTLSFEGAAVAETATAVSQERATTRLDVPAPRLWWPRGLGDQPLYDLEVALLDEAGTVHDTWTHPLGLRTLRLVRAPDQWGESFHFEANGLPFFAKGANWIPADALITDVDDAHLVDLLESAAQAHMNMLRVWGGGVYESDLFYTTCDRLGLAVWQDFMFTCSTYPTFDADFMASVEAEADDALRRLRHHACLALWCGNNELEQGLVGEGWTDTHMDWADYDALFNALLPRRVEALDPGRSYWPGSPHTPGHRTDFNDPTRGDAHLWDVWHGKQPFEWYRTTAHRFCSEFGFQSFPEPRTTAAYTEPGDRNVTSYVMELHQRSAPGNALILHYLLSWFRLPTAFDATLWLSQILQGNAMQAAVEHWRRSMPRGMGTLYWQLNDCWPVASWSSLDYFGRWKALHHLARRFYAPLLVTGVDDGPHVALHLTSDHRHAVAGTLRWTLTDLDGMVVDAGVQPASVAAQTSMDVGALEFTDAIARHTPRGLLLWLAFHADGDDAPVAENLVLFARPKHLDLRTPTVSTALEARGDGAFDLTLRTSAPALWTWIEIEGAEARLSDNFFHLRPGVDKTVRITPSEAMTTETLRDRLRVRSLVDTYA